MNTMSAAVAAAVIGARHLRIPRNGQDAAAAWANDGLAAAVVCDGCSAGASSELGARLGAQIAIAALRRELSGSSASRVWPAVRERLVAELTRLVDAMPGDRDQIIHDHFLFTIVAVARRGDEAAVWAIGDGGYGFGDRARVLGPFADNQPPYLGYELLGARPDDHLEVADAACGSAIVATDGVAELGLERFSGSRWFAHPDALRRQLAVLARASERIDWGARTIVRRPAELQDDGAVAMVRWR